MRTCLSFVLLSIGWLVSAEEWKPLPSLPDKTGFAGSFAGVSNGALIFAGGANFPNKKPWEGGEKVWYDSVFVLEQPDGVWKNVGKLPRPLGYGVSVSYRDSVICVGGSDAQQHYATAFRLEWKKGQLTTSDLPPLPQPLANCSGALVGDHLYVAGGLEKPDSTTTSRAVYRMDLKATQPQWVEIESLPGSGRMLAVAAGYDGAFWLVSGVDLVIGHDQKPQRNYLTDAYRYDPSQGWQEVAELPHPVVAAPSPAPSTAAGFIVLGGDDGSLVHRLPSEHRGFNKTVLHYNAKLDKWIVTGEVPAPRVTVPSVWWQQSWVFPSGEMCPGVRSPEVWSLSLDNQE